MSFLYTLFNFMQVGVLIPAIAFLRPMLLISALGFFMGYSRKAEYDRKLAFKSPVFIWLAIFLFAQCLSLLPAGISSVLDEFGFWHVYLLFVVISVLLIPSAGEIKRHVWGMMVGSMVVVIYGIYSVPAWGGYIHSGRAGAYGMYENHNDYSFIIIQLFPFLFMYRRAEKSKFKRLLLGLSMLACMAGMFMSLSRGGMISLMLEIFLCILIGMEGRKRLLLIPIMAVLAVGAISYQYAKRAQNQGDSYTAQEAETGRFDLWKAGFKAYIHNPVFGVGSRRFYEYSAHDYELGHDLRGKVSHNTYVEVLAGTGTLGIVSFLMMLKSIYKALRRKLPDDVSPWLEITRRAALIGFLSLLFRAFLDAKQHDWSFYFFCSVAIAIHAIRETALKREQQASAVKPALPTDWTRVA
jgi:O-antigen ligase